VGQKKGGEARGTCIILRKPMPARFSECDARGKETVDITEHIPHMTHSEDVARPDAVFGLSRKRLKPKKMITLTAISAWWTWRRGMDDVLPQSCWPWCT